MTTKDWPKTGEWPLDCWYAVGWATEISSAPVARTVCDQRVVVYRRRDGTPVALEDACMHRLLPLSMGFVEGDDIVCGYHGMKFDCTGRCVRMPVPGDRPPNAGVPSFTVAEKHNMVWLWAGEASLANPDKIPDLHWADDPAWAASGATLEMECDFKLLVDNLMDLTHETYVHGSSIGHARIVDAPFDVTREEDRVTLSRWMIDCEAPPFLAAQLQSARGHGPEHVDRWQIIHFKAPSTVVIDVGVAPTGSGAPEGDRSQGISGRVLNAITPVTYGRCHYFFAFARDHTLADKALSERMRDGVTAIFTEDKVILEEQQRMIDRMPDRKLLNLNIDKGSLWARRAISEMAAIDEVVG